MKEKELETCCVDEIMHYVDGGKTKLPSIYRIEIKKHNYDNSVLECNLPCSFRWEEGRPVEKPCPMWNRTKKECKYKGDWYEVLLNGCAVIWSRKNRQAAKEISRVLESIAKRCEIEFESCFNKDEIVEN